MKTLKVYKVRYQFPGRGEYAGHNKSLLGKNYTNLYGYEIITCYAKETARQIVQSLHGPEAKVSTNAQYLGEA